MTLAPALVVDTNVASLPLKSSVPSKLDAYSHIVEGHTQILSFATVAELLRWAEERRWGDARRKTVQALIDRSIVAHSDADLCANWATLMALSKRRPQPLPRRRLDRRHRADARRAARLR